MNANNAKMMRRTTLVFAIACIALAVVYPKWHIVLGYNGYQPDPIIVSIDVKPGSDPNAINLGSYGLIPVAILSTDDFDATSVDPDTVELAGAEIGVQGKSDKLMAHQEDVNGDDLIDLLVHVATANLDPDTFQGGAVTLTGQTFSGETIEGYDDIIIVPKGDGS